MFNNEVRSLLRMTGIGLTSSLAQPSRALLVLFYFALSQENLWSFRVARDDPFVKLKGGNADHLPRMSPPRPF